MNNVYIWYNGMIWGLSLLKRLKFKAAPNGFARGTYCPINLQSCMVISWQALNPSSGS